MGLPGGWTRTSSETALAVAGVQAGALYPFFGALLSPMIANATMTFSSVSAITNARRLRRAYL